MGTQAMLPLRCSCGEVRGELRDVSADAGFHVVCMCRDCQAYAAVLGEAAVVDEHGGTEIFQTTPSRLAITSGAEHLACLRLSARGLLRFHTACCNTPIGNTAPLARVPFVGFVCAFIDPDVPRSTRDQLLGPVLERLWWRDARGEPPPGAPARPSPRLLVKTGPKLLRAALRGEHRPSPFFDDAGRLRVTPRVLSVEERAAATPVPRSAR